MKYKIGRGTYMAAMCIAIMGAIPCACLPCLLKSMKDVEHFCPNCKNILGVVPFGNQERF